MTRPPDHVTELGISLMPDSQRVPRRWRCRVTHGPDAGAELWFERSAMIGAGGDCDLVLTDTAASRHHARLTVGPQGVALEDLDSTNGTRWMGGRISSVQLPEQASFGVGESTLQLSATRPLPVTPSERARFGGLVGGSLPMREIYAVLERAAPTDATVLILGESGTGKEVAARALHDHSQRAHKPFVVVDCSAVTEELLEAKLFGHRRGAFTGAVEARKGAFVEADGGTLFIDELGELTLASQAKLLRVLEQQEVVPVGADLPRSVDVRVIAATHRDLRAMVDAGAFRFDLYHRLAVVHLRLPPLREHLEDLPAIVSHFYEGRGIDSGPIDGDNLALLERQPWPGNVRELRNVLERGWTLGGQGPFAELLLWLDGEREAGAGAQVSEGEPPIDLELSFKEAKERCVERFERRYLAALYEACDGNVSQASKRADLSRRHLRELLIKHGLHGDSEQG